MRGGFESSLAPCAGGRLQPSQFLPHPQLCAGDRGDAGPRGLAEQVRWSSSFTLTLPLELGRSGRLVLLGRLAWPCWQSPQLGGKEGSQFAYIPLH